MIDDKQTESLVTALRKAVKVHNEGMEETDTCKALAASGVVVGALRSILDAFAFDLDRRALAEAAETVGAGEISLPDLFPMIGAQVDPKSRLPREAARAALKRMIFYCCPETMLRQLFLHALDCLDHGELPHLYEPRKVRNQPRHAGKRQVLRHATVQVIEYLRGRYGLTLDDLLQLSGLPRDGQGCVKVKGLLPFDIFGNGEPLTEEQYRRQYQKVVPKSVRDDAKEIGERERNGKSMLDPSMERRRQKIKSHLRPGGLKAIVTLAR